MTDPAFEALRSLLEHPGWHLFVGMVKTEWGDAGRRFDGELGRLADTTGDDTAIVNRMRQVAVARREILRLLQWPHDEAKRLAPPPESSVADLAGLAALSRRGGL